MSTVPMPMIPIYACEARLRVKKTCTDFVRKSSVQPRMQSLCETFAKFACLSSEKDAYEFYKNIADNIGREKPQSLAVGRLSVDFPVFNDDRNMTEYPVATLYAVGRADDIGNGLTSYDGKGSGSVKKEILAITGMTAQTRIFQPRRPDVFRADPLRPSFSSSAFWVGDICLQDIDFPAREKFLRRSSCLPSAMMSTNSGAFVTADPALADKILAALQIA